MQELESGWSASLKSDFGAGRAVEWGAAGSAPASSSPLTAPLTQARARLSYLDGIRGLAATYVVLFHAVACFAPPDLPGWARVVRRVFAYGHEAVAVFIVLSGYSLMLPVVRASGRLNHGALGYLRRRARRILPPYYATLAYTLALVAAVPALQEYGTRTIWDDSLPAFEPGPIVSHALL
ncbi:MAG TPA: acyltransferase family protein, partial [Polyangiales bacterium]